MGKKELTFALIKPDAIERALLGEIINRVQKARFNIEAIKSIELTQDLLRTFYKDHVGKSFFENMIDTLWGKIAVAMVLSGDDAVIRMRQLIGSTDPLSAAPGTLRSDYGISIDSNSIHASDSTQAAIIEITLFFPEIS